MKNFRIPYFWVLATPLALYGIGAVLNILAISVNHGMMPVVVPTADYRDMLAAGFQPGTMIDNAHKVMEHGDHLKFLCDWIQIPHTGTASIGDGFLLLYEKLQDYFYGAWMALVARYYFRG